MSNASEAHTREQLREAKFGSSNMANFLRRIRAEARRMAPDLAPFLCAHEDCSNEGRYDSGYCGLCDIKYNNGEGVRLT